MTSTKWLFAKWVSNVHSGWEIFDFDMKTWTPSAIYEWIFKQHPKIEEINALDIYEMDWEQEDEE